MTNAPNFIAGQPSEGKVGALIAWTLFILSIPSANVLVLIGLVVFAIMFIVRRLRETFGFEGTPLEIGMRVREKRGRRR